MAKILSWYGEKKRDYREIVEALEPELDTFKKQLQGELVNEATRIVDLAADFPSLDINGLSLTCSQVGAIEHRSIDLLKEYAAKLLPELTELMKYRFVDIKAAHKVEITVVPKK